MTERGRRRFVKEHGLLYYVGLGLSFGLLALVLLLAGAVVLVPAVTGSTPYTILTSSMEPSMPPGTLVIVKPIDPKDIKIGTVVTYQLFSGEKEVVTHRVLEIQGPTLPGADPSFITKGDANSEPDAKPVMTVQLRGAVWYSVPWIGWVNNIVNGDLRAIVIPIVAGLLFLYAGWSIVGNQIDRRRRRRREEAQEAAEALARSHHALAPVAAPDYLPAELTQPAQPAQPVERVEHHYTTGS